METTKEIVNRANSIEAAICKRVGISSEDYLMLFFESGCQAAERCGQIDEHSHRRVMTSNIFWYWWAQRFMRSCEAFMLTFSPLRSALTRKLENNPPPHEEIKKQIAIELTNKQKRDGNN